MTIQFTGLVTGLVGVEPQFSYVKTDASLSEVTTEGFLKPSSLIGFNAENMFLIKYSNGIGLFSATVTDGVVTLSQNNSDVILPTTANYAAAFADVEGTLKNGAATLTNPGNINAGLSGTAGSLKSFSGTASKGSLEIKATANTGDTVTSITNAAMGQATALTIPDPVSATGNINVSAAALVQNNLIKASTTGGLTADAGFRIACGTGSYGGGGTSIALAVTGLGASWVGSAVIRASTNAVAIAKAVPTTNTLTITFTADPGANTTIDYIYSSATVAP